MPEVLETETAFQPGAFPTTKTAQERFVLRLLAHRYARPELPAKNWMTFAGGGLLAGFASGYLLWRGQEVPGQVAAAVAIIHGAFALFSWVRKQSLKKPIAGGHPHACHIDEAGQLMLSLAAGEQIAARLALDTPKKEWIRWVAGLAQTFWGLLLAGIPPIFLGEGAHTAGLLVGVTFFSFLGTLLFGKGVRDIFGLRFAETLFITNHRMALVSGPGEARSLPLDYLKQRPVVVGRSETGATLGLALIPLVSVGRLPAFGLWGKDNMKEEDAKNLAAFVVRNREQLIAQRGTEG